MPLESYTQSTILEYLRLRGGYWVKFHENQYTPAGVPDIVGCYRGLFVAFEVKNAKFKNPHEALSLEQHANFQRILEAQGMVFCVNNLDQVKKILDAVDKTLDG